MKMSLEEVLIEKVRGFACLYNAKHKDYRDANIRQIAWENIGQEIGMPGPAAKEIWDKLRRCFVNARNRSLDTKRSGAGAKKKVVWKFEEQMSFLLPFLETRKTHNNLNENQTDTEQLLDLQTSQPDQITVDSERNDEAKFGEQQPSTVHLDGSVELTQRKKHKGIRQNSSSAQLELVNILKESAALRKRKYEEQGPSHRSPCLEGLDEMDLFFLSMSRMIKNLPKAKQSSIKLHLSNYVLSAEVQHQQLSNSDLRHERLVQDPTPLGGSPTPRYITTETQPTPFEVDGISCPAADNCFTYHAL